eukprot:5776478-Prorocentrum_lima.AAC.1
MEESQWWSLSATQKANHNTRINKAKSNWTTTFLKQLTEKERAVVRAGFMSESAATSRAAEE